MAPANGDPAGDEPVSTGTKAGVGTAGHDAEELADIVRSADDAVIAARLDGRVSFWNAAAERLYGYSAEEVAGRPLSLMVGAEHRDEWDAWVDQVRSGRAIRRGAVHRMKSGPDIHVTVTLSPIRDRAGVVTGISVVSRDNADQKAWAAAVDAALAQTEGALSEAREAQETCRQFLADAAHQLRTPMTGIQVSAETLLRGPQQAQRDKLLANLVRETSRSSRLIGDLLRLAHLDEARSVTRTPTDLVALCRDEVDRAWSMAPRLDVVLRAPEPECQALVDEKAVREIVANLLDNARRHARDRIEVDVGGDDAAVVVRVADDGPGLPADSVEKVFKRFVSLDGMGGSGLGLPIAKELARAHDGDLTYEDHAFVLRLPVVGE